MRSAWMVTFIVFWYICVKKSRKQTFNECIHWVSTAFTPGISYLLKLNIPWPLVIGFCCPVKTQYVIQTRFKSLIRLHLCSQRRILHIIAWAMKMKFFSVLNMTVIILFLHQWTACINKKSSFTFSWTHPCSHTVVTSISELIHVCCGWSVCLWCIYTCIFLATCLRVHWGNIFLPAGLNSNRVLLTFKSNDMSFTTKPAVFLCSSSVLCSDLPLL